MLKAVFFDLDGTLLPAEEKEFTALYFSLLTRVGARHGYEPEKLMQTVWEGTYRMFANDGSATNERVFWDRFAEVYGRQKLADIPLFDAFYANEFQQTKAVCRENPLAKEVVAYCRKRTGKVVLTTNPVFPTVAYRTRMAFVGLRPEDFDGITTYENSHFCKPNPKYFEEVLQKTGLAPDEVVLFGNNDYEDGECAAKAGIRCYLVGDTLIHSPKTKMTFPEIAFADVPKVVDGLLSAELV